MNILAIETSCDETGIAILHTEGVLDADENSRDIAVLANIVLSQAHLHAEFGGVFPNLARREHAEHIAPLIQAALADAGMNADKTTSDTISADLRKKIADIFHKEPKLFEHFMMLFPRLEKPPLDAIAVTAGPGLEPALWVGINTAEALGALWDIPVIPVNHMEGHIVASLLSEKNTDGKTPRSPRTLTLSARHYPAIALLISGGHTELVLMREAGSYELIGQTRDDAVGEAFDKVARILGLGYPGGPLISKLAEEAPADMNPPHTLPRPMLHSKDFDFSFAGLKTAVLYMVKNIPAEELTRDMKAVIAREFENSASEVLLAKTLSAVKRYGARDIIMGGGVSANKKIRGDFRTAIARDFPDARLFIPSAELSTDNGLMIGVAGLLRAGTPQKNIRANGTMRLS